MIRIKKIKTDYLPTLYYFLKNLQNGSKKKSMGAVQFFCLGEVPGYVMDHPITSCSKSKIEEAVWGAVVLSEDSKGNGSLSCDLRTVGTGGQPLYHDDKIFIIGTNNFSYIIK
ncbi:hypothetical protein ACFOU2_15845 [Bacillus songklensis]|uniref:Uncharacterized protein n=1 Tax=Bacillus songklensis TaxID=1069116 RepID=A0ABV8B3X7_9BACI